MEFLVSNFFSAEMFNASQSSIVYIATGGIFDPNHSRAAGRSSKPLSESQLIRLLLSRRLAENGLAAYRIAERKGFEGIVAKDNDSLYEKGRSRKWLKVKVHQEEEFVIGGFTAPEGERKHLGALLLGAYRAEDLHFVGKVGTGFSQSTLAALAKAFRPLTRSSPPFVNPPREKNVGWLEPRLVAQDHISGMDGRPQTASASLFRSAR
jgi:ATP-dependent DNA ligase